MKSQLYVLLCACIAVAPSHAQVDPDAYRAVNQFLQQFVGLSISATNDFMHTGIAYDYDGPPCTARVRIQVSVSAPKYRGTNAVGSAGFKDLWVSAEIPTNTAGTDCTGTSTTTKSAEGVVEFTTCGMNFSASVEAKDFSCQDNCTATLTRLSAVILDPEGIDHRDPCPDCVKGSVPTIDTRLHGRVPAQDLTEKFKICGLKDNMVKGSPISVSGQEGKRISGSQLFIS